MPGGTRDDGPALADYVLIVSLIVFTSVIGLTVFGSQIGDILSLIADRIHE